MYMAEEIKTDKKLISAETKRILLETTADIIRNYSKELDEISKSDKIVIAIESNVAQSVENYQEFTSSIGDVTLDGMDNSRFFDFSNLNNLSKYRMLIGFLNLDFAVASRIYLKAQFQYEEIFSIRQLYVIANEGYKRIFNFGSCRKKSMWVAEIGRIIDNDFPELKLKHEAIISRLEEYEPTISPFRDIRDLSVHYDTEPIKVYNMMIELNTEKAFQEIKPFMSIINDMYSFINVLHEMVLEQIIAGNLKFTRVFANINQQVEEYKNKMIDSSGNEGLIEV